MPDPANITELYAEILLKEESLASNLDQFFLLTVSMIIFLMQAGFASLEAGSCRAKNVTNILMKNWLDACIGAVAYWLVGYAFAHGTDVNGFIGNTFFLLHDMASEQMAHWFFHFVFAATAATIVSGAMAERTAFAAYTSYSALITGFIYPIVSHWAWNSDGWLALKGYQDFAGSGVVHACGGMCALVGAWIIGPRINRFDPSGRPMTLPGHSVFLSALGGFILWFGFFAFNGGSQAAIAHGHVHDESLDASVVALAMVNTTLAAAGGAFVALFINYMIGDGKYWSLLSTINGALGGMVAICAGCNAVNPWAALVIGMIAGAVEVAWSKIMLRLRIDDPLDAVAVHLGCGIWGVCSAPMFDRVNGIFYTGTTEAFNTLGWNLVGVLTIMVWSGALCGVLFTILKVLGKLRVSEAIELDGLDVVKHGEISYPEWFDVTGGAALPQKVGPLASNKLDVAMEPVNGGAAYTQSDKEKEAMGRNTNV